MLSELQHLKDPTYYTFLETKQVFCCEVPPNGTSDTVISRQLNGDTDSGDVISESVTSQRNTNVGNVQ